MSRKLTRDQRILEIILIVLCLGLTCLFYRIQGYKMVVLNVFFLPVVLAGFHLGRYAAGVLSLFCVFAASIMAMLDINALAATTSAPVIFLAVTVWSAVLGLTAIMVGTLSDDRERKIHELHDAYIGAVEVLSQYLQSAHPSLKARSVCVAELCQQVATEMRLSSKQVDDIRVAALLYDMENVEISARVIRRAVGSLESSSETPTTYTFQGRDLVLSLSSVLSGAIPLLLNKELFTAADEKAAESEHGDIPLGARLIRAVREYHALTTGESGGPPLSSEEALDELRIDASADYDPQVVEALARCLAKAPAVEEPVAVG